MVMLEIVTMFVIKLGAFFMALDTPQPNLDGFSILDIFIAIMFLDIIVWFIRRLLSMDKNDDGDDVIIERG